LFQIYRGICVPISIQIKKDMIKLLQKQNGAVFYASQCSYLTQNFNFPSLSNSFPHLMKNYNTMQY